MRLRSTFLALVAGQALHSLEELWWPVRRGWPSAVPLAWFWVVIEMINGILHPAWSLVRRGYAPGVLAALVSLPLALLLARQLLEQPNRELANAKGGIRS